jgi:hypothetical protein
MNNRIRETYWNEEGGHYEKVPDFPYPSELELLKLFLPEAKEIIEQKICEWTAVKEKVFNEEVLPVLKKIAAIPDESIRNFNLEAYKSCFVPQEYVEALEQLARLERLKLLTSDTKHSKNIVNFEKQKETAKQTPIENLYPFKKVRRFGKKMIALCPFHTEKTPSFNIFPDNTFHCFGCQAHGDAIDFMILLKGCDFKEAIGQMTGVA